MSGSGKNSENSSADLGWPLRPMILILGQRCACLDCPGRRGVDLNLFRQSKRRATLSRRSSLERHHPVLIAEKKHEFSPPERWQSTSDYLTT